MPVFATLDLLNDARAKYHALMTGTSARVLVDQNGERVEFTAANKIHLYNYIAQLETQLGTQPPDVTAYHPAGFVF